MLLTISSDDRVNILKVVIRLLKLIIEEQVVLRELKVAEIQLLDHVVPQNVGYECQLWLQRQSVDVLVANNQHLPLLY